VVSIFVECEYYLLRIETVHVFEKCWTLSFRKKIMIHDRLYTCCQENSVQRQFNNTNITSKTGKVTDFTNLKEGQTIDMMQMASVVSANID
jgi:hypothetical protein